MPALQERRAASLGQAAATSTSGTSGLRLNLDFCAGNDSEYSPSKQGGKQGVSQLPGTFQVRDLSCSYPWVFDISYGLSRSKHAGKQAGFEAACRNL
jgi:hypothetical protein